LEAAELRYDRSIGVLDRNNVRLGGASSGAPMVFAHGFGCDQHMWRWVEPAFADRHPTVLFDHVGSGGSNLAAFDERKYASLAGYAGDVIEICDALQLRDVIFVGHSVSAMIGVLAACERPELFQQLVLVGPSPRYIDDIGYQGGFTREDIDGLLDSLDSNFLGWAGAMAPVIMGNPDRPALGSELAESFCRTDPDIARHFAHTTFLADNRDDLERVSTPTLVLQCREDVIAPRAVGEFVHARLPSSKLVILDATGHCPNLSAPGEVVAAIEAFL
jgi:sigma-B regulation protein RsbQ